MASVVGMHRFLAPRSCARAPALSPVARASPARVQRPQRADRQQIENDRALLSLSKYTLQGFERLLQVFKRLARRRMGLDSLF